MKPCFIFAVLSCVVNMGVMVVTQGKVVPALSFTPVLASTYESLPSVSVE